MHTLTHASPDVLVLDAKLRQSLVSVRSLGRRGLGVAALEVDSLAKSVPTFSSRFCREALVAPSYEPDPTAFLDYLERALDRLRPRVLFASADGTVALLRRTRARFEPRVRVALSGEPAMEMAINKEQTVALAAQLGIAVPEGVHARSVTDVPAAIAEVGLPLVAKPVESWNAGERLFCQLATTDDEARLAVEGLTRRGGTVLMQRFLPGEREAVSLFYVNGQVH